MAERKPKESPEETERRMLARAARVESRTRETALPNEAPALGSFHEDLDLDPKTKTVRAR